MGLLFLLDRWDAPSELWMQRMIEILAPHIRLLGAANPSVDTWRQRIPVVPIEIPPLRRRHRIARKLGLKAFVEGTRDAALLRLREIAEREDVDRVLVHYLTLAVRAEPVWTAVDKPLFVHCHGFDMTWDLREPEPPHRPVFGRDYVAAVRRLSDRATLIANSHTAAMRLTDIGVPADRVEVKYLGVPVPETCPERPPRTRELNILYLGRLVDCKRPDLVIRAFETACERGLEGRLEMAGDGPMRGACEQLRERSSYRERIHLHGSVSPETGRQLRDRADIFTAHNARGPMTNQEEAYGVTIVEAMSEGLPVVSGRNGSLPELIDDGRDGILVAPGDVEAHADALLRLAGDPALRRRIARAAWEKARERFSLEREKRDLLGILGLES